jgi:hypothetical protein
MSEGECIAIGDDLLRMDRGFAIATEPGVPGAARLKSVPGQTRCT